MSLVPLHVSMELNPARPRGQPHGLGDGRGPERAGEVDPAPQGMALDHLNRVHGCEIGDVVEIGTVNIPGVESQWMVVVELEQVATPAVGQHFSTDVEILH